MLLRHTITVWTDHRNLTYKNTEHANDRVLRQRLLLKEYAVSLIFIQRIKNVAADMLSRNEQIFEPTEKSNTGKFEELVQEVHSMEMTVPVDYEVISQHQADDKELKEFRSCKNTTKNYKIVNFGKTSLWTKTGKDGQNNIWLPSSLRKILLEWYYDVLQYPGERRLEESIRANFTCPGIGTICKEITGTCETSSKMKLTNVVKDDMLPLRDDKVIKPLELLSVDLC